MFGVGVVQLCDGRWVVYQTEENGSNDSADGQGWRNQKN